MYVNTLVGCTSRNDTLNISATQTVSRRITLIIVLNTPYRSHLVQTGNYVYFLVQILTVRTENAGSRKNSPADTVCTLAQ